MLDILGHVKMHSNRAVWWIPDKPVFLFERGFVANSFLLSAALKTRANSAREERFPLRSTRLQLSNGCWSRWINEVSTRVKHGKNGWSGLKNVFPFFHQRIFSCMYSSSRAELALNNSNCFLSLAVCTAPPSVSWRYPLSSQPIDDRSLPNYAELISRVLEC